MNGKIVKVALGAALAMALAVVGTTPATANPNDVIRRGSCSGSTDWKLKLSPDDNGIEVEYEVDSNVNGQRWRVRIRENGARIFAGSRVTGAPSGSFDVRVVASNSVGIDRFRARAVNPATGEVCVGTLSL
jgi:hypothetical protein